MNVWRKTKMAKNNDPKKVITGWDTRWSYCNVWEAKGTGKTVPPLSAINNPLNDGDEKRSGDPAYQDAYYLNAKNYQRAPGIVDKDRQGILDHSEVYSGVYGRVCISFFAYNKNGNKGIGCSLHHLQKGRDGEPLGGFTRAEDEFDDGEEDFLS